MAQQATSRSAQTVTGVSNVAFDVLTILNNKLQGLAAMRMYKENAQESNDSEVLNQINEIEQRDLQDILMLKRVFTAPKKLTRTFTETTGAARWAAPFVFFELPNWSNAGCSFNLKRQPVRAAQWSSALARGQRSSNPASWMW